MARRTQIGYGTLNPSMGNGNNGMLRAINDNSTESSLKLGMNSTIASQQPLRHATRRGRRQKRELNVDSKIGLLAPPPSTTTVTLPRIATASSAQLPDTLKFNTKSSVPTFEPLVTAPSKDLTQEEGQNASASSIRGLKPGNPNWINQDNFFIMENFDGRSTNIYCVLDGHGEHGHHVSRKCREMLPQFLRSTNLDTRRAFALMQTELQTSPAVDANCSGATCVTLIMQNRRLTIANCGDSRAVLGVRNPTTGQLQSQALSNDHKPDRPEERKRIVASGGRLGCRQVLVNDHGMAIPTGPCRVWYAYRGDSMGLAMSRSLGDLIVHNVGVTAEPEVLEHMLDNNDEFVILATDGVWDVIDNNQAVQLIATVSSKSPSWSTLEAALLLTKFARSRWTKLSLTADDITCVVVKLR